MSSLCVTAVWGEPSSSHHPIETHVFAAIILGDIVTFIYPVRIEAGVSRRAKADELERRLDRWYHDLPEGMRYDVSSKRTPVPPPNVLMVHVRYWSSVLLLHRAFIPNWKGRVLFLTHYKTILNRFAGSNRLLRVPLGN